MFKGKTVVVTGGSRGIGAAVARKFASLGADIAIIYAGNEEAAKEVSEECVKLGAEKTYIYRCKVENFTDVKETVARIKADFGGVDILVNNAGITKDGLVAAMSDRDFSDVIDVNLKGTFNMIRHCAGIFIRKRSGRIINISSVSGITGNPGQANYSASKAGIIGLTKTVAKELAPRGITCNAIAPGFIATDMTKDLLDNGKITAAIPLGRVGTPEEVAQAAVFLASAGYITGEVLKIDGGMAI